MFNSIPATWLHYGQIATSKQKLVQFLIKANIRSFQGKLNLKKESCLSSSTLINTKHLIMLEESQLL